MSSVFISYSHKDKEWLDRLQEVLVPLMRMGILEIWSDSRVEVGDRWREKIEDTLEKASVALLLVSPSFLASDFLQEIEIPALLDSAKRKGLNVLWVPVAPALYEGTPLASLQAAWNPNQPLSTLSEQEVGSALVSIAKKIKAALDESPVVLPLEPVKLIEITLQGIKCFENTRIPLGNGVRASLLMGPNARGKSTILQALALGLKGISRVPFTHAWKKVAKTGAKRSRFTISLEARNKNIELAFEIHDDALTLVASDPLWFQLRNRFLVFGYGANRHIKLEDPKPEPQIEPVATLFGENGYLKHVAASRTHDFVSRNFAPIRDLINDVFASSDGKILLEDYNVQQGFLFQTPTNPKEKIPLEALSEGFKSTFVWLLDMVVRCLELDIDPAKAREAPGILLLDEIDLHLHPQWQRTILPGVTETFPNLQIIATTHSPFVAQSVAGTHLTLLSLDGNTVAAQSVTEETELSYEAIVRELFGIDFLFSHETEKLYARFREIKNAVLCDEPYDKDAFKSLINELAGKGVELDGIMRMEMVDLKRRKGEDIV